MALGAKHKLVPRKATRRTGTSLKTPEKNKSEGRGVGRGGRGRGRSSQPVDSSDAEIFYEAMPSTHPQAGPPEDWECSRCGVKHDPEDSQWAQVVDSSGSVIFIVSACDLCWKFFMHVWRHLHSTWPNHCTSCASDPDLNRQVEAVCQADDAIPTDIPVGSTGRVCEGGYLVNFNHVIVPEDKITDTESGVYLLH